MANPHPTPRLENLRSPWQPGASGNPAGYSQGRRISDAIENMIDEQGLPPVRRHGHRYGPGKEALAQAEGDDPVTGRDVWVEQKPDLAWFQMIVQRIEPVPQQMDAVTRLSAILDDLDREELAAQEEQDKAAESAGPSPSGPGEWKETVESASLLSHDVPRTRQRPGRAPGRPGGSCRRRSRHDLGGGTTVLPAQAHDPKRSLELFNPSGMLSGSRRSLQRVPGRYPGLDCCGPFRASPQATSEP